MSSSAVSLTAMITANALFMVFSAAIGGSGMDTRIQHAIDTFQPAWLPEKDSLPRIVVVVHPACGESDHGTALPPVQVCSRGDDRSLLAAEHLFHLIRIAGGVPVLTRADDRPTPGGAEVAGWLRDECETARCHLLLSIDLPLPSPDHKGAGTAYVNQPGVRPIGEPESSAQLAEAIAAASGLPMLTSTGSTGLPVPAVSVTFAGAEPSGDWQADRAAHQANAAQIFRGLAAHVAARGDAIERRRTQRWPRAQAAETQPVPLYPNDAPPVRQQRAARQIWPHGRLPQERAVWYAQIYRRVSLSDRTIVHFEPEVTIEDGAVVLGGTTNVPALADGLTTSLRAVGIERVRNAMRILPEDSPLGTDCFGVCTATMVRTFTGPSERSGPQTQLLYGEPVFLLDRRDGFLLVQAADGYWGWAREDAIRVLTPGQFNRYAARKPVVLLRELQLPSGWVRAGSRLPLASRDGHTVHVLNPEAHVPDLWHQFPTGGTADIDSDAARNAVLTLPADAVQVVDNTARVESRLEAALAMLHTPYVFGARSPIGLDCSGFVTNLFEQEGLPWARDAAQQFLSGKLVATRWHRDGIQPGDLLYFIDAAGKIFHTGVALSPTHFIHSSPPGVQINSLRKDDRLYRAHWDETFFCAKRP
jgi:gamma-D-glutamyl-L-lysine dipeptidyl-peptidase